MIEQLKTIRAGLETATCYSMLGVDAHSVQLALTALTQLEAMVGEPVYWQWRRKGQPWSLEYTFNSEVHVTTDDSERRALYAAPVAQQQEPAIYLCGDGRWVLAEYLADQPDKERFKIPAYAAPVAPVAQQPQAPTESVLIDGIAYDIPTPVAAELLRLHIEARQPQARPDFVDEWTGYLKDGETPFERFLRERKDMTALTKLYQRALEENESLKAHQPQAEPDDEILKERDDAEDFIDMLLDEVLGTDRPEWTSAYGRDDALRDVQERMTALHKPTVDKAWDRFEKAQQPQAEPTDSMGIPLSCGKPLCSPGDHHPLCKLHKKPQAEALTDEQRLGWYAWRVKDLEEKLANAQKQPPTEAVPADFRDRLVAISQAIADQDDRAAQAMIREILAAPQQVEVTKTVATHDDTDLIEQMLEALRSCSGVPHWPALIPTINAARKRLETPQQAEAVPSDVVRDAERYRWLRAQPYSEWKRIGWGNWVEQIARDTEIDAAIAQQKGGV